MGGIYYGTQNDAGNEQVPSACEVPFMSSFPGEKSDGETEREEEEKALCAQKVS